MAKQFEKPPKVPHAAETISRPLQGKEGLAGLTLWPVRWLTSCNELGNTMLRTVLSAAFLAFAGAPAEAWDAMVDGPDVFGKTKVVASEGAGAQSLVVQCDSEQELFLAFIFRKKEFEDIPEIPAKLFLKASTEGEPIVLDAKLRSWNDNYAGVVASGRDDDVLRAVVAIGDAKNKIDVGYEILGQRESASFSSRKSGQAIKTAMGKCKLSSPSG